MLSPGAVTPVKIFLYQVSSNSPKDCKKSFKDQSIFKEKSRGHNSYKAPLTICLSTQCDLSLYQVPSKSHTGFTTSIFQGKCKSRGCNSYKNNWTEFSLQYAHLHNAIVLCTKFHQNSQKGLGGILKPKSLRDRWMDTHIFFLSHISLDINVILLNVIFF
jgi:hypothetical protein